MRVQARQDRSLERSSIHDSMQGEAEAEAGETKQQAKHESTVQICTGVTLLAERWGLREDDRDREYDVV